MNDLWYVMACYFSNQIRPIDLLHSATGQRWKMKLQRRFLGQPEIDFLHISIVDIAYHAGITDCWPAGGLSNLWFSIAFGVLVSQHGTTVSAFTLTQVISYVNMPT
jgi:hypothetical protein